MGWRCECHLHTPLRRKWASCSTAGNLNFCEDLLSLDRGLGDYVIVHELLHFCVPNHGKLCKSRMLAHLGDHERPAAPRVPPNLMSNLYLNGRIGCPVLYLRDGAPRAFGQVMIGPH
jgi:Protein of unknown function DUF45